MTILLADIIDNILNIIKVDLSISNIVTKDSRLLHDLWIYGDDAWTLFEKIGKEYQIEHTLFCGRDFFPNETTNYWFIKLFSSKWAPMTIEDLAKLIQSELTD
jgi:hypothetical protein